MSTAPKTPPPCPDLEDLAAFADGRLTGAPRQAMMEHLDRCSDCFEILAATLRFQGEQREQDEPPLAFPGESPRAPAPSRRPWWYVAAAASLVAAALLVPRFWGAAPASPSWSLLAPLASQEALEEAARGAFDEERSFLAFGGGRSERRLSFLLGVKTMDLAVAVRAGEGELAWQAGQEIARLAAPLPTAEEVARKTHKAAGSGREEPGPLVALEETLTRTTDPRHLAFGSWVEAARLAARGESRAFFTAPETWDALPEIPAGDLDEGQTRLWRKAREAAESLREGGPESGFETVESALTDLIRLAS